MVVEVSGLEEAGPKAGLDPVGITTHTEKIRKNDRSSMNAIVAERGQVTIPKALRDKFGIVPGTVLDFTEENARLVATKCVDDHPAFRLLGKRSRGRRTPQVMAELRGKAG